MSKRIHPSWLIAVGSLGVVGGAVLSLFIDTTIGASVLWFLVGALLATVGFVRRSTIAIGVLLIAGMSLGLFRGSTVARDLGGLERLHNHTVVLSGSIAEDPSFGTEGDVRVRLNSLSVEGVEQGGVVWVSFSEGPEVKRSDVLSLEGRLSEGFGNIPAAMYRARVLSVERQDFADVGRDVRDSFADGIRAAIQEPEASLASGFLVGQKTALPEKLDGDLRLLGLTHVVVASGYNLSILVRYSRKFFNHVSRFTALATSSLLVFGFMQITGASPSMARASLVTGLSLITWYYGRKVHPFVLLSLSAGITVAINPTYAWGDIGWLLSFTSFIGVMILSPLIHAYFWDDKKPGVIRQTVFETMSAQILTFPIIAFIFGQYSPLSLLANLLILPLIPFVMGLIFAAGLAGIVVQAVAPIAGFPAEVVLRYMTTVVDYLAGLPLAAREVSFPFGALIASYAFMLALIVFLWRKSGHKFRDYNLVE